MRLNLTWWRKRPSVHVADYGIAHGQRVTDISDAIVMLNPVDSPFLAMMESLASRTRYPDMSGFCAVGDIVRRKRDGRTGRIVARPLKAPDDWFSTEREIEVKWDDRSPLEANKFNWLEDDFMPRIISDPSVRRGTAILTNIS